MTQQTVAVEWGGQRFVAKVTEYGALSIGPALEEEVQQQGPAGQGENMEREELEAQLRNAKQFRGLLPEPMNTAAERR